ncbi:MAG: large-conductance mechanosensitive channel protein MscL [Candidatus Abawacabacteria bacterium]|nr:large-conductance mechanosensitive channel protein MscL [Candidatus Abawacabacteria bacterium]
MLEEFKKFAVRGNVIDMAIGIMIGTAFNRIVSSLVEDIIMPPLGLLIGGVKFADYKVLLRPEFTDIAGKVISPPLFLNYGSFIGALFNFLIIAFSMFVAVKMINTFKERLKKQEEVKPSSAPQDIILLTQIRDLLANKK